METGMKHADTSLKEKKVTRKEVRIKECVGGFHVVCLDHDDHTHDTELVYDNLKHTLEQAELWLIT